MVSDKNFSHHDLREVLQLQGCAVCGLANRSVHGDPRMQKNLAGKRPETVKAMFSEYVLKDAGGPLHNY
jgi:hypothetical protein